MSDFEYLLICKECGFNEEDTTTVFVPIELPCPACDDGVMYNKLIRSNCND